MAERDISSSSYGVWRRIHLGATCILCILATVHVALTIQRLSQ